MNNTQNKRILQVTKTTLIVGIDVASEIHYARAFDNRGIEQAKVFKFTNDLEGFEGFEAFAKWLDTVKSKSEKKSILIGMEPTGHYWFNLAQHLTTNGIKIVLVNSFAVKRSKELDDCFCQAKNNSPELNPVEQIWDEVREKGFKNEVFNSLLLVEDRLCDTLVCL